MLPLPWRFRLAEIMAETVPGRLLVAEANGCDDDIYIVDTPERLAAAVVDVFERRAEMGYYDAVDDVPVTPREILDYLLSRTGYESEWVDIVQAIIPEELADVENQ